MRFIASSTFAATVLLVLTSLFGLKGLTSSGFYTSHDGETHTARIAQYYKAFADGQIPPRFGQSFYNYLTSPIFVYIYPLPYALGAQIHALGFSYVNSFKILMSLGFIVSVLSCFLWLKVVLKSDKAAFFGALMYTWIPYKFLLIYVRASVSELLAYAFVPLVFYFLTLLAQRNESKWMSTAALSTASVLLSQNLVALLTVPVIAVYIVIYSVFTKSKKYFFLATTSLLWGLAIAAVTYVPAFFERNYTRLDQIINIAFVNHFVTIKQLIRSPWGYGFDLPGTVNDQMSFQIGLAHLLVLLLTLLLTLYFVIPKPRTIENFQKNLLSDSDAKIMILNIFFVFVLFASIFFMVQSKSSLFFWQNIKLLQIVDIPWRFLGLVSISMALIGAFVARTIKPGLIFLLLVFLVFFANRNHLRINQSRELNDAFFDEYKDTATQYNEFTPKWRQTERAPLEWEHSAVDVIKGDAEITDLYENSKKVTFTADSGTDMSLVRINKFYFPRVEVHVDGKLIDFTITDSTNLDLSTQIDTSGLVQIEVPKGKHHIVFQYKETPLRQAANLLSLLSFMIALFFIVKNVKV